MFPPFFVKATVLNSNANANRAGDSSDLSPCTVPAFLSCSPKKLALITVLFLTKNPDDCGLWPVCEPVAAANILQYSVCFCRDSSRSPSSCPGTPHFPLPVRPLEQVGENLQDHLLGTSMHLSKTLMSPADFAEDGLHGMAYIRCPLRPESGDSEIAIDTGGSKTNEDASSLVLGFMFADGGIIPSQIVSIMRLTFTQSGFLGAMAREVIFFLVWLLVRLTPISWIAKHSLSANVALTTVKSRGTVRLASGDPTCPPVIDPAYLSHPDDEQAIAAAWRTLRRAKTETATGKAVLGYEISPGKM